MRFLPLIIAIILLLFAGIAFKKGAALDKDGGTASLTGSYIEGLRIVNRENGTLLWSFTSERAVLSEDGTTALLKAVRVNFPDRDIEVEAAEGSYHMDYKDLFLKGGITARTNDYIITTDSARLLRGRELRTDGRVFIEGKGLRIEGNDLRAKDNAWALKNVTALLF